MQLMKLTITLCLLLSFLLTDAQEKPKTITLTDISYPILGMKISPSSNYIFLTLAGGRFLLYDISKGKLDEGSRPVWKNFNVKGFDLGGDAEFSQDGKYILVSEQNAAYAREKPKVKPFAVNVVDVANGTILYEAEGVNSAQFLNDNESILLTDDEGIETCNFKTKVKSNKKQIADCEIACLNKAENILAVSYDPSRSEFKEADGAGNNRKEVRNALRNKKLIAFYEYPSMKKAGVINEEIDVVFRMQFTDDDNYLLFFSRTRQTEHTNSTIFTMSQTLDLNQFQRIDMSNFKVDNVNFIHQTSEQMANFDINPGADLFAFSDNKGLFAGKREVLVTRLSDQQNIVGSYTYQGRARTRNIYSSAFAITGATELLVANGLKMCYWDFGKLPKFIDYIEPTDQNEILDKVTAQLDADLQSPVSSLSKTIAKKQITGLFLFNITVQKNGEVVSLFAQSDEKTNIAKQNLLKDILLNYKFDVSLPKNERVKFTYTFNL
jgi:hypothetical protein